MRVTDDQARAAMEAYYAAFRFGKQDGIYYSEEERLEAMRAALEAALSHAAGQEVDEQRDMSILDKYAEVASALGFEGDAWFGDPLAGHEEIVHRAQNYADEAWTAKLRRGMDEYAEALADVTRYGRIATRVLYTAPELPKQGEGGGLGDEVKFALYQLEQMAQGGPLAFDAAIIRAAANLLRALAKKAAEA